jgi:two-component system sensor histidine kinase BarA
MVSNEPSILYVEDHPASRRVMELLLVDVMGFNQLTLVGDTNDIIQNLEAMHKHFDVIFLDVNLQPHDGYAVCTMLRTHEQFRNAKIVGLTASVTPAEMRKMQAVGFDGVIAKPLSHATFPEQLEHILAGEPLWESM